MIRRTTQAGVTSQWDFLLLAAYVGAAVYFIGHSDHSFWQVVLGLLKALVWPAYVLYDVLTLLHA